MTESGISVFPMVPAMYGISHLDHKALRRLYCKNGGYLLRILPNGAVDGSRQDNDTYTLLKVKAISAGVVAVKGHETEHYLAVDKCGVVYSTPILCDECYFIEKMEENNYNTYRSHKYQDNWWYLGIKKNGQMKTATTTHKGQNAVCFLPMPVGGSGTIL